MHVFMLRKKQNSKILIGCSSVFLLTMSSTITRLWLSAIYDFPILLLWCNSISVQSSTALFSADQLNVHVCVAAEEIMHLASSRLGIHGYCKVSKETLPRILTMLAWKAFFKWKVTFELKGQASCSHQTTEQVCMGGIPFLTIQWLGII